jgi:hypothetical protein
VRLRDAGHLLRLRVRRRLIGRVLGRSSPSLIAVEHRRKADDVDDAEHPSDDPVTEVDCNARQNKHTYYRCESEPLAQGGKQIRLPHRFL